jgi:hypothetical protein
LHLRGPMNRPSRGNNRGATSSIEVKVFSTTTALICGSSQPVSRRWVILRPVTAGSRPAAWPVEQTPSLHCAPPGGWPPRRPATVQTRQCSLCRHQGRTSHGGWCGACWSQTAGSHGTGAAPYALPLRAPVDVCAVVAQIVQRSLSVQLQARLAGLPLAQAISTITGMTRVNSCKRG